MATNEDVRKKIEGIYQRANDAANKLHAGGWIIEADKKAAFASGLLVALEAIEMGEWGASPSSSKKEAV